MLLTPLVSSLTYLFLSLCFDFSLKLSFSYGFLPLHFALPIYSWTFPYASFSLLQQNAPFLFPSRTLIADPATSPFRYAPSSFWLSHCGRRMQHAQLLSYYAILFEFFLEKICFYSPSHNLLLDGLIIYWFLPTYWSVLITLSFLMLLHQILFLAYLWSCADDLSV